MRVRTNPELQRSHEFPARAYQYDTAVRAMHDLLRIIYDIPVPSLAESSITHRHQAKYSFFS